MPKADRTTGMTRMVEYTVATVRLAFPAGRVQCALCPLLQTYSRNQCMRTGELIADTRVRGIWCPLEIEEEKERDEDGQQE